MFDAYVLLMVSCRVTTSDDAPVKVTLVGDVSTITSNFFDTNRQHRIELEVVIGDKVII